MFRGKIEGGEGLLRGIRDFRNSISIESVSAGTVAAIFGCTGPVFLILKAARAGGLNEIETISWVFSVYFFSGIVGLILALYYKQPICGAWSMPGVAILAGALKNHSLQDASGAYLLTGVIILFLGLTGIIGKIIKWLPIPIVMAMIAGILVGFCTDIFVSLQEEPLSGLTVLAGFFITILITKKVPPIITALTLTVAIGYLSGDFSGLSVELIYPQILVPSFNFDTVFSITIPMVVMIIGTQNIQAYGVLISQGYKPPVNAFTVISGIGTILTSFFGGHNINIAGPRTAICSSEQAGTNKKGRYTASVVDSFWNMGFGLAASITVVFVGFFTGGLLNIVAGLALLGVLIDAFEIAFGSKKYKMGSFFAFIIALSGITILQINASFWSLIGGIGISLIFEFQDFNYVDHNISSESL